MKTVAIWPPRVDAPGSASRKTAAIATVSEMVARIGGVAGKGAAEQTVAPDEREC